MRRAQKTVELDVPKARAFMQRRGMTAAEVSAEIGASNAYMSNVLNGNARMSMTAYKMLCTVFEVPEDTFTKPEQPQTFTATLESVPDAEIMERLDRIESKLDKLLGIWGSTS